MHPLGIGEAKQVAVQRATDGGAALGAAAVGQKTAEVVAAFAARDVDGDATGGVEGYGRQRNDKGGIEDWRNDGSRIEVGS